MAPFFLAQTQAQMLQLIFAYFISLLAISVFSNLLALLIKIVFSFMLLLLALPFVKTGDRKLFSENTLLIQGIEFLAALIQGSIMLPIASWIFDYWEVDLTRSFPFVLAIYLAWYSWQQYAQARKKFRALIAAKQPSKKGQSYEELLQGKLNSSLTSLFGQLTGLFLYYINYY